MAFIQKALVRPINRQLAVTLARKDEPTLLDHFVGFQQAPALVAYLKKIDPAGHYECIFDADGDVQRFRSLTIICSWWLSTGLGLRPVLSIDGAGLESRIGGTLIACVSLSGNNNIVPLGLLLTSVEAGETVTPFMVLLKRLYPVQEFVISDSGKAFEAGANAAGYKCHGGCSWHVLKKNAAKMVTRCWWLSARLSHKSVLQFPGAPKLVLDMLKKLVYASTEESYKGVLASAKTLSEKGVKPYAKIDELLTYVDERFRRENLVVPFNVARPVPFLRFGQSTNNPAEQFFAAMRGGGYLCLPLPALVEGIISHTVGWRVKQSAEADKLVAAALAAPGQPRLHLTAAAVSGTEELASRNADYNVAYTQLTVGIMGATVTHTDRKTKHNVVINVATAVPMIKCCAMTTELARPCIHVVAAIMHVPKQHAAAWSAYDLRFYGRMWHAATWQAQLSTVPVAIDTANAHLEAVGDIRPWPRPPKVWLILPAFCFVVMCSVSVLV